MHLANQIVMLAQKYARGKRIKSIAIDLGDIFEHGENITPENLKYNINLILPGVVIGVKRARGSHWRLKEVECEN